MSQTYINEVRLFILPPQPIPVKKVAKTVTVKPMFSVTKPSISKATSTAMATKENIKAPYPKHILLKDKNYS